jgi:hypothetical protein
VLALEVPAWRQQPSRSGVQPQEMATAKKVLTE